MLQCFESFKNIILNLTALPPAILTSHYCGSFLKQHTSHHKPPRPTTSHHDLPRATTSHDDLPRANTTQKGPVKLIKRVKIAHSFLQSVSDQFNVIILSLPM